MQAHPIAEDAGEIKALRKKSTPDPWYKRYAREYHEGTRELKLHERGAYSDILDLIYMAGGPIKDDERAIAHRLYVDVRTWRPIRKRLLALGKLYIVRGYLYNAKAKEVLDQREIDRRSMGDRSGIGRGSAGDRPGITPDLFESSNDFNASNRATSTDVDDKKEDREIDDDGVARTHEVAPPSQEPAKPTAVLVRLDDHRPLLSEKHYADFRDLCDTFGRKAAEMVISPTPRDTSDDILIDLVRSELSDCPQQVGQRAIEAALRAAKAATLTNRQNGHAGKSAGGISALLRYLEHAVRSQAAEIQIADAAALAKLHTEKTVQTRVAEKRMSGVERGGGSTRKRGSSWDDIAAEMGWEAAEAQGA